jgi:hypothetical protein
MPSLNEPKPPASPSSPISAEKTARSASRSTRSNTPAPATRSQTKPLHTTPAELRSHPIHTPSQTRRTHRRLHAHPGAAPTADTLLLPEPQAHPPQRVHSCCRTSRHLPSLCHMLNRSSRPPQNLIDTAFYATATRVVPKILSSPQTCAKLSIPNKPGQIKNFKTWHNSSPNFLQFK